MQHTILITGASGNLGSKVAFELLKRGAAIKVTGRNRDKLAPFEGLAPVLCGDLEDEAFLRETLQGVTAVFLVMPALRSLTTDAFAALFTRTAEAEGVTHLVNISNCTLKRWDQWTSLLEFEQALDKSPHLQIRHLRCANFFENLNWGIHTPYHPEIKLPYISSHEIAHRAAAHLQHLDFTGKSVEELMGPRDYSMRDFAELLGVPYQQQPLTEDNRWFFGAFNSGQYELVQRTEANTSKPVEERFTLGYFLDHHFNKEALNTSI